MDQEQFKVIELIKQKKSVLLLGQAGTGKSRIILEIKNYIKNTHVYITSTTGISALNIKGVTLHSFLGIGLGDCNKDEMFLRVSRNYKTKKILKQPNILIVIDEVSMLSVDLFEKLNFVFQKLRNNPEPFGGIQLLLSGDFFQLEPINTQPIYASDLIKNLDLVLLKKNYRQTEDPEFQKILTNLRTNNLTEVDINILKNLNKPQENAIRLFTTNNEVNNFNSQHLKLNNNSNVVFNTVYSGKELSYKKELEKQFKSRGIDQLILKKGLKVMLTRNLDVKSGLVNGTLGIITNIISNIPIVKFFNVYETEMRIEPVTWSMIVDNKTVATATQIPLIIAYASTVHKCQGLTIDKATIDLKNVFANHMIYVALSRVRSLDGISLLNFDETKIKINAKTLEFYSGIDSE